MDNSSMLDSMLNYKGCNVKAIVNVWWQVLEKLKTKINKINISTVIVSKVTLQVKSETGHSNSNLETLIWLIM